MKKSFETYNDWMNNLPNSISHIDSTSQNKSVAYIKINSINVEVGAYYHNAGCGEIRKSCLCN